MACGPSPEAETTQDAMPDMRPSQVVLEGYFEYTERGRVVQSLEAAKLERWESSESAEETPDVWHVDGGFTLYIGGTQAKHNAKLSAVRGTYDDEAGRLEAWEEVVLVNEEGERLETEHLIWSHDSDLVRTDRPVAIHSAQGVLRGRGLTSDSRFERYEILSPTGSFDLGMDDTDEEER
tara:strand:+ start:4214 stop:4750 length:537 start_codon:yes stop_codon:yes gene_type:complete